jgi:hypothetical protein
MVDFFVNSGAFGKINLSVLSEIR